MKTFRAVLFTKEDCLPCTLTKDHLNTLLSFTPNFGDNISVLQKENHRALVKAYELESFPTLMLVDSDGEEMGRLVGGKSIREDLRGVLYALRTVNKCA